MQRVVRENAASILPLTWQLVHCFTLVFSRFVEVFTLSQSPLQPAGLRHCNAAAFASLKKFAALIVFNPDCVGTEPKEAANPVTGEKIV